MSFLFFIDEGKLDFFAGPGVHERAALEHAAYLATTFTVAESLRYVAGRALF